ncbi:restriction endonuclease subunit S [Rahnella laticis]|uniref:restriction endonuclease subunit S n=1 Tax=Rahnella laticis TaxID=2787622 RepID=UPI0018A28CEA|nr:restriction endonuclease subunit S [Rahnella laticis]MBF7996609.1 restriction endonuclease subunit S [Rahnella laticis]
MSKVPAGWENQELGLIAKVVDCKHRTPVYVENGIPLVSPGTIKWGPLDLVIPNKRVSEEEYESLMDHCDVEINDLVLSRNQSVGVVSYVSCNNPFVLGQDTVLIKPKDVNKKFLFFKFQSKDTQKEITKLAGGSTFSRINLSDIRKLRFSFPPLPEQTKIAQILSTWDKAITTTEQLIGNSQQQKKSLMQSLLTGKKRLPGFEGEWLSEELGSLGETYSGLTGKTKEDFGSGYPYISYMNVYKNTEIDIDFSEKVNIGQKENQYKVSYGDIFFTTSSETPEEVGMSSVLLSNIENTYLNSFCFGYRLFTFERVLPEFCKFVFRGDEMRRKISKLAQGATRYNLSKKRLMLLHIDLPPLPEQQKIAAVLTAADNEIELLQKKLAFLKQEKAALMQQLLTGKRRVKVETA